MSLVGVVRRVNRWARRTCPRTDVRLLGLRKTQSGQSAIEYVGLVAVVVAIVGALLATGIGPTIAEGLSTQVCKITGGENCGGGGAPQAQGDPDDQGGQDDPGGTGDSGGTGDPASDNGGDDGHKTQTQLDYDKALKELQDARTAEKSDQDKALEAAKELAKILAEELGITDALDCITKGDMGACTETLINVLLSVIGGAVGKLAAKYGAPWKWKKAVELVRKLKKHGGELYDGLKGLIKNRKRVGDAEKKLADARKKLDAEKKKPKDGDKPTACPVSHSFPPGTPVLLAGGRRIPIETVRVGDRVRATDPASGATVARQVTDTITTREDKAFTRLIARTQSGPAVITATDTHPFWVVDLRRWVHAGEIRPGAFLRTSAGTAIQIGAVRSFVKRQTTHDLTVSGIHTYYVAVGDSSALVHNNDCLTKYKLKLKTRPANYGNPRQRAYQRRHAGDTEYQAEGGGEKVWADGFDSNTGELIDAKFVDKPDRSPFIKDSKAPDFIREKVDAEINDEFRRYAAVLKDKGTPVNKLRIVTNDPRAVQYFQDKLRQYGIPGQVVVKP
ncbi:restriction endonuclease fold toxin-2 domain-containing protein [Streptomyces sp. NBC_01750]|uniref:restriction endonuclease fold toxin-2 domain-containing protein n=1 Tax=Streptomyces sp. NBC_01750 TaxID=2975928 RepID=UPI002DDBD4BF|nr:restriction endonuclease fold toxin-2 domain-containing protein [Streptomyces sp. NBC_01750]WSD35057.1 polymorphic toxin-type HINT domain-containing protein [Streptomyces sp. NBC_01750]